MTAREFPEFGIDPGPDWNPDPMPLPGEPGYVTPMPTMGDPGLLADQPDGWAEMMLQYDWLPPDALQLFLESYFDLGDMASAWAVVRKDERYASWFPGNVTEDGRVRYSEASYAGVVRQYDDAFIGVGLDPAFFRERYGELIAGDVTPEELERDRLVPMYERIVSQSDALRYTYASYYGVVMSDAALLAAAIDPELGDKLLTKQISIAEIGGEALESGYKINEMLAQRMVEEGQATRGDAESLFQRAEAIQPMLAALAARHADPDDTFDINEFVAGDFFKDPTQMRRMRRLAAQEASTFTGGAQIDYLRTGAGGVAGLAQR